MQHLVSEQRTERKTAGERELVEIGVVSDYYAGIKRKLHKIISLTVNN